MSGLVDLILGRPLTTEEERGERVGPLRGVPILGLDALGSAAYGTEALLTVLLPLGAAALVHATSVMLVIVALLGIVYLSYRGAKALAAGGASRAPNRPRGGSHYRGTTPRLLCTCLFVT